VLTADRATKIMCRGVTGHAADRRMIGANEVQLLQPRNHLLSSGTKIGEADVVGSTGDSAHTYREDTRRNDSKWAFLGRGSVPPELDEEDPAVVVMATTVVNKPDETCRILSR
jgi:hypothetical protein